jgi:DNA-binding MarR family transcriptional regulator
MSASKNLDAAQAASFGHVLFATARMLDDLAQGLVNAEAGQRLARPSVMRLLPHLSFEGVRPVELARRLDISKQAVGQTLAMLAEKGYITDKPDPTDGRGRLVCLTEAGAGAFHHGLAILEHLEKELAARLESPSLATTFKGLRDVHDLLCKWAQEGPPPRVPETRL